MESFDFVTFAEQQAKRMGLFSNSLVTLLNNIEEFVWFILEPELTTFPKKAKEYDFFTLKQKIDLLVGNLVNRGRNYKLSQALIQPDLFELLNLLRKRRNVSAHSAGFLYDKLVELDNLSAPCGNATFLLTNSDKAALTIDIPKRACCAVLKNETELGKHLLFKKAQVKDKYNLVPCELCDANVVLTFWKTMYYNYNHDHVDTAEEYLAELQFGNSVVVYALPTSQMRKLKDRFPKMKYNYGHHSVYYAFDKNFLFANIAKFSHPTIKE